MKTCCDCLKQLSLSSFVPKPSCKNGYEPRCRKCRSVKYNKSSPALLCKKIYLTQVNHSATRGHPLPSYTLDELTNWVLSQPTFKRMYEMWQTSDYQKDLAPSVDRLNDNTHYTLQNIQLMTWTENRSKASKDKKDNVLLVNHRAVTAYNKDGTLHKRFLSMSEAMRELGGKPQASHGISSVCNGVPIKDGKGYLYTPKTYKGYVWKWA